MPTDHILDRPDDWTQTFWGSAGIQFASRLPYLPVGPKGITPWIILRRGAINGFELGCALSLHDPSLGKSILEKDSTNIDRSEGKPPANWESVYDPVIQDLHRRISQCGTSGPSYRNMFPESGPDLTQPDASKIIARQVFRGVILPLISEDAAEQVLISGTEEDEPMASSWYFDESSMKSMPIPELLTLVKQRAASVYRQWAEAMVGDSPETTARTEGLAGKDLSGADLAGTDLTGADLTSANLTSANLTSANLTGADLTSANLSKANFTKANLHKADLSEARFFSANFYQADLKYADLSGADLMGANMAEADMTGAKLTDVTDLELATFTGATMKFIDLTGFVGNMTDADLTNANLTQAKLSCSYLSGANFTGAGLWGADLRDSDLSGSNLTGADLAATDMSGAVLIGANLTGVVKKGVPNMIDLETMERWSSDSTGANLTNADLADANLTAADLSDSNLAGVNLTNANLTGADLTETNLTGANFAGANLTGADLTGANLTGIVGADLTGAILE